MVTLDHAFLHVVETVVTEELLEWGALHEGRQILLVRIHVRHAGGFVHLDTHRDDGRLHLGDEIGKARWLLLAFRSARTRSQSWQLIAAIPYWASECEDRPNADDGSEQHE